MVTKSKAIFSLARDIMKKIKNNDIRLSNVLLQAAELSHLTGLDENIKFFTEGSQSVEKSQVFLDTYKSTIEAAKDPPIAITSANPNEFVGLSTHRSNSLERNSIRQQQQIAIKTIANYRAKTYEFVMKVYYIYLFGQEVSTILDSYKERVLDEILKKFPELKESFEVINENITSINTRGWAAVASECRNILIKLSSKLWKRKEKEFIRSNGEVIKVEGEKNKLIAYIDTKIGWVELNKARNTKLCGIIHEIFDIGGKQKREINKTEVETSVVNIYILIAELITYTDLNPVV